MKLLTLLILHALLLTASLAADELLQVTVNPIQRAEDGNTATALVVLRNKAGVDMTDIDIDLVLTSAGKPVTLTAANHPGWGQLWSCTNTGAQSVRCHLPLFRGSDNPTTWPFVPLVATIDPAREGRFSLTAHARGMAGDTTLTSTYEEHALYEREVLITNTGDTGEGSLRAALEYANDACARDRVPCALQFRFTEPLPEQGWYTIRPWTPLPAITASDISITGSSDAPRVELDGSLLTTGHGLQLQGEGPASVDRLTIGGFPWDGIAITRSGGTGIYRCAIGVHSNGRPNPNRSRGVTIDSPASDVYLWANRISANRRSGVFIAGGERIELDFNTIGDQTFQASFDPLLGNGASGVFAGPAARDVLITTNYIGGNTAGVAVARGARVENTWIDFNGAGLPVDHGIDGFSGHMQNPSEFALPAPRLESITYDDAAKTVTIRGTFDAPDPAEQWKLTFFGDSFGIWPEMSLPHVEFTGTTFTATFSWWNRPTVFRATVSSAQPNDWSTSEFSEPIRSAATSESRE
jgi:hypothetical protein